MHKREKIGICLLITVYFLSRLINLTTLPIFNDEAIYLHWAQIMAGTSEKFFSVTFDGKQPLGMWLFGLSMSFFKDPLVAGRIVSIIFGFLTILGVFFLAKELGGFKVAVVASILYIVIPYSLFFDRLALMESMVSSVGIWSLYLTQKLLTKPKLKQVFFLGIVLGIGFWFKSTALTFLFLSSIFIFCVYLRRRPLYLNYLFVLMATAFLVILPLLVQPSFALIFKKNQEFLLSFSEILKFPLGLWLGNILRMLEIFSGYVSPFFLPVLWVGIFLLVKERKKDWYLLSAWCLLALLMLIFTSKNLDSRYLLFTIPGLLVFCSLVLVRYPFLLFFFVVPAVFLSTVQIGSPTKFFAFFPDTGSFAADKYQYATGWPSGYGVNEAIGFIQREASNQNILVGVRLDSGNPEDAVWVYLVNEPKIKLIYFLRDDNFWRQLKVVSEKIPVYFISRDNQLLDHENDMREVARFVKPEGKNYTSVQKL